MMYALAVLIELAWVAAGMLALRGHRRHDEWLTMLGAAAAALGILLTIVQVAIHWTPWTWWGPVMPSALAVPVSLAVLVVCCWADVVVTRPRRQAARVRADPGYCPSCGSVH